MALSWDLTKVENFEALMDDSEAAITEGIIWHTMFVGMPTITADNYIQFFGRVEAYARLMGEPLLNADGSKRKFTVGDVARRIGLTTNASRYTDAQFRKHLFEIFERYQVSSAVKAHEKGE